MTEETERMVPRREPLEGEASLRAALEEAERKLAECRVEIEELERKHYASSTRLIEMVNVADRRAERVEQERDAIRKQLAESEALRVEAINVAQAAERVRDELIADRDFWQMDSRAQANAVAVFKARAEQLVSAARRVVEESRGPDGLRPAPSRESVDALASALGGEPLKQDRWRCGFCGRGSVDPGQDHANDDEPNAACEYSPDCQCKLCRQKRAATPHERLRQALDKNAAEMASMPAWAQSGVDFGFRTPAEQTGVAAAHDRIKELERHLADVQRKAAESHDRVHELESCAEQLKADAEADCDLRCAAEERAEKAEREVDDMEERRDNWVQEYDDACEREKQSEARVEQLEATLREIRDICIGRHTIVELSWQRAIECLLRVWERTNAVPSASAAGPVRSPPDFRPRCIRCHEKWLPPEGVDAQVTPCPQCSLKVVSPPDCPHPETWKLVGVLWCTRCGAIQQVGESFWRHPWRGMPVGAPEQDHEPVHCQRCGKDLGVNDPRRLWVCDPDCEGDREQDDAEGEVPRCPKCKSDDVDNVGDGDRAICMGCDYEWVPTATRLKQRILDAGMDGVAKLRNVISELSEEEQDHAEGKAAWDYVRDGAKPPPPPTEPDAAGLYYDHVHTEVGEGRAVKTRARESACFGGGKPLPQAIITDKPAEAELPEYVKVAGYSIQSRHVGAPAEAHRAYHASLIGHWRMSRAAAIADAAAHYRSENDPPGYTIEYKSGNLQEWIVRRHGLPVRGTGQDSFEARRLAWKHFDAAQAETSTRRDSDPAAESQVDQERIETVRRALSDATRARQNAPEKRAVREGARVYYTSEPQPKPPNTHSSEPSGAGPGVMDVAELHVRAQQELAARLAKPTLAPEAGWNFVTRVDLDAFRAEIVAALRNVERDYRVDPEDELDVHLGLLAHDLALAVERVGKEGNNAT